MPAAGRVTIASRRGASPSVWANDHVLCGSQQQADCNGGGLVDVIVTGPGSQAGILLGTGLTAYGAQGQPVGSLPVQHLSVR